MAQFGSGFGQSSGGLQIDVLKASEDTRRRQLEQWLNLLEGFAGGTLAVASADASFRRYFRYTRGTESFIVMDAPPPQEDCRPFVEIAGYLDSMQLNAPRVLAHDLKNGFLLLTDLGQQTYLDVLNDDNAEALYGDALQSLVQMQRHGRKFSGHLPPYDETLLRFELSLFSDWLCGTHLGLEWSAAEQRQWQRTCDALVENALGQPQVLVHRDYHSRNLMVCEGFNPGILDFQDAVQGPLTYDLVSLLKDCYVRWPVAETRQRALSFFAACDDSVKSAMDQPAFLRAFDLMGAQRHLKAAGIFARLCHRDGKTAYIDDIPTALSYVTELHGEYDATNFIAGFVAERVLPALESAT